MKILNPEFLILIPIILFLTNKKNLFYSLSAIFLVLALSNISKETIKKVKIKNNDVLLVIDTTYSMMCNDLKPNRLEYAKKEIIKLIKSLNIPIGIISFDNNIHILSLPTTDKNFLISKIKSLKATKSRTDIKMAINSAKNLAPNSTIILISDGGEQKIDDNFIFFGFATKKGAKVPGFNAISKLNIIGKKYFKYNETDKLINYLKKLKKYKEKEIKIYKPINFIFASLAFISFGLGIIMSKFRIFLLLIFLYPNTLKANDLLGCLFEYIGLKNYAIKEFKKSNTNFSKLKLSIYFIEKGEYKQALKEINQAKPSNKQQKIKALILIKLKKYQEAFNILKNLPLNKEEALLLDKLKQQIPKKSIIFPTNSSNSNSIQKGHLW